MGCAKAMRENVHFLMTALQKFCWNDFEHVYAHNFWTIYTLDLIFGTHEPLYMQKRSPCSKVRSLIKFPINYMRDFCFFFCWQFVKTTYQAINWTKISNIAIFNFFSSFTSHMGYMCQILGLGASWNISNKSGDMKVLNIK